MKLGWLVLAALTVSTAHAQDADPPAKTIEELQTRLKDPDRYQRLAALRKVGKLRARVFLPDVVKALEDKDQIVQYYAVMALGDLQAVEELPKIRPFLRHENPTIKLATVAALLAMEDKDSVPEIISMTQDRNIDVRWDIMKLVGMSGLPEAQPVFMKLLDDPAAQPAAIMALGHMRLPEAGDKIVPLVENPSLQFLALYALGSIDAKKYAPELRKHLGREDVKFPVATGLATIQDPDVLDVLLKNEWYSWLNYYSAPEVTRKLAATKLPIRYVRTRTVVQAAQAVAEHSGLAIEFSDAVGKEYQNAVFGTEAASLGLPNCFSVLSAFGGAYLEDAPGQLHWIVDPKEGLIRFVTSAEARTFWEGSVKVLKATNRAPEGK